MGEGGAVLLNHLSEVVVASCNFTNCTGFQGGGVDIATVCTDIAVSECYFTQCDSINSGGGFYTRDVNVTDEAALMNRCSNLVRHTLVVEYASFPPSLPLFLRSSLDVSSSRTSALWTLVQMLYSI